LKLKKWLKLKEKRRRETRLKLKKEKKKKKKRHIEAPLTFQVFSSSGGQSYHVREKHCF
jgi:hypothetical protein